ncbi:MAG: hypothetical protein H7A32_00425 [Deltaproteobacteria bacterium]|nr:hypothetical protein [Deltaproteobacteria bacterium]
MGNTKKLSEIPLGKEIQNSTLYLETNKSKRFILVMKNNSSKTLHFFAAPHELSPPELSLGFKFKCLCLNHVYKIPPGEYWYRVVEIHLDDNFKNKEVNVTHDLIKVDS